MAFAVESRSVSSSSSSSPGRPSSAARVLAATARTSRTALVRARRKLRARQPCAHRRRDDELDAGDGQREFDRPGPTARTLVAVAGRVDRAKRLEDACREEQV